MKFKLLEIVVLQRDVEGHGLMSGDTGTVVELYGAAGIEVEFLTGAGTTKAVLTLPESAVRHLSSNDMLAVRSVHAA